MQKLPPIEKIYEAYSAIADGRITMFVENAIVLSSNMKKEYNVTWNGTTYRSNDSATYWQGYAGYPIIAVLMLQGKLPLKKDISSRFAGINWTELNTASKRDYIKAVETVFEQLHYDKDVRDHIQAEIMLVYESLKKLDIEVKRGGSALSKKSGESKE